MVNLYIDESGSMTTTHTDTHPYFVIAIVKVNDARKARTAYKLFVKENMDELRRLDLEHQKKFGTREMFYPDGKFKELKGNKLTRELKEKFIKVFCNPEILDLFYVVIDNTRVSKRYYNVTARAFNYCVKLAMINFLNKNRLPDDCYSIEIDERNVKTNSKATLQEYLNTELCLGENLLTNPVLVNYFDSCNKQMIQVADVFANIMYSYHMTLKSKNNYAKELKYMKDSKCLKKIFDFPYEKIR